MVEIVNDVVIVIDLYGKIFWVNFVFSNFMGYCFDEIRGEWFGDFL